MKKYTLPAIGFAIFLLTFGSVFAQTTGQLTSDFLFCSSDDINACSIYSESIIAASSNILESYPQPNTEVDVDTICAGTYYLFNAVRDSAAYKGKDPFPESILTDDTLKLTVNGQVLTLAGGTKAAPVMAGPFTLDVGQSLTIETANTTKLIYTCLSLCPEPAEPVSSQASPSVIIYPEDEFGAYYLNEQGAKEYIGFHSYDICMRFMGSESACANYSY